MSLYADYLLERTHDQIVETEYGFATYRFLNTKQCYIIDIYVKPENRKTYRASEMADKIAEIAKEKGCCELLGTIVPSTRGSNTSLNVLMAYGMKLSSAQNDLIIMKKDI